MLTYRRFDPLAAFDQASARSRFSSIPMDAVHRDDEVVVHFDLPGADADSIDLTVDGGQLTVEAERAFQASEDERVIASERVHGSVKRTLQLGENLDASDVAADFADGVLTVRIPFVETAKPRKVAIGAGAAEATSDEA